MRDAGPARPEPVAEMPDRSRSEGDVDERVLLEDSLALRLGIAAAHGDHRLGPSALERGGVAEMRGQPLVGLLPDRAGVEDDDVGLLLRLRLAQAQVFEQSLDALRVMGIHLAAEGRDEVAPHGRAVYAARLWTSCHTIG